LKGIEETGSGKKNHVPDPARELCRYQKGVVSLICLLAILGILLETERVHADPVPFRMEQLTVADGLSQNAVVKLYQDSRGLLWISTEFGLNSYDGYAFHSYPEDPAEMGPVLEPIVYAICEDAAGDMWFGSPKGLDRLEFSSRRFTHYFIDPAHPEDLGKNWIVHLVRARDGSLWAGSQGNGLIRFDPKTGNVIRHYRHRENNPGSLSSNTITCLYLDHEGGLWVGTPRGLDLLTGVPPVITHFQPEDNPRGRQFVAVVFQDSRDRFWVGTFGGLLLLDPDSGCWTSPFRGRETGEWLSNSPVFQIAEDLHGSLWVASNQGLNRAALDRLEVARVDYEATTKAPVSQNILMDLLVDTNGILWAGTYGDGIRKIVFQPKPFGHQGFDPDITGGLNDPSVLGMVEDDEGIVWIGTNNRGLNRWDRKQNQYRYYQADPKDPRSIIGNSIRVIRQSRVEPDVLWLGIRGGLDRFNKRTETFAHFQNIPGREDSLSSNMVYALEEDHEGILWVGTWGGGLNRFHRDTGTFTRFLPDPANPGSISHSGVTTIFEDSRHRLWIGTWGGGLNCLDRGTGTFRVYKSRPKDPYSLGNNMVLCIYEDRSGHLWVGSGGGLNRLDPVTGKFTRYTQNDGLPDNVIYGILEDEQGDLWLSTNKGLSRFLRREGEFRNYSPLDGLQAFEYNMHSYFKNSRGELYFGGINGFNVFDPARIIDHSRIPPVMITEFRIFNQPVPIEPDGKSPLPASIRTADKIRLTYLQHTLTFGFSALDFTAPRRNQYAYRLEGLDDQWNYLGNKREITLAHLPPGQYTFRVRGSNSDGIWNEEGASLDIEITPPFWQTVWFKTLIILLAAALLFYLYTRRVKKIRQKLGREIRLEMFCRKNDLSDREIELVTWLMKGKSNREIEELLYISLNTVKNHIYHIYRKLGVDSRHGLVTLLTRELNR